jgi:hypothetical protein
VVDARRGEVAGFADVALSPDGTKVAFVRSEVRGSGEDDGDLVPVGWGIYDTRTGRVTELRDESTPEIGGGEGFEVAFTGDSRYLQTAYSRAGRTGDRSWSFVVWHVGTGAPTVVERPGHYWLPNPGSAPDGVVWSRGDTTYRYDVAAGGVVGTVEVPDEVVQASFPPRGRAFAYLAHAEVGPDEPARWWLHVQSGSEDERVALDAEPAEILGWRDPHTVVVTPDGPGVRRVLYVDVRSARVVATDRVESVGASFPAADYAADLWAQPLVDGEEPPDVRDPRLRLVVVSGSVAAVSTLALVLLVRRRRRVRP